MESDSMGEVEVPAEALFGASTMRAIQNFPISGHPMPSDFIQGLALVKFACASANEALELLPSRNARWIQSAAMEIHAGKWVDQFPVDVFQTGSGTSTNTNMNEVVARLAMQLASDSGEQSLTIHPNDDVNLGQSSNDVMPTALHLSGAVGLKNHLLPTLVQLQLELSKKAEQFNEVVKLGRTHLMDAVPMTLGQEFSGYSAQILKAMARTERAISSLRELPLGGTAVGTGLNTDSQFAKVVCCILSEKTGIEFVEASNHFEAQGARDDVVEVAGILVTVSISLAKIANDIRFLASGPRSGLNEIRLPALQPGSSIMAGKTNPVMCEMLTQVASYAQGLGQTIVLCGREGHFELNANIPLMAYALHEIIGTLARGVQGFTNDCVAGIEANVDRCKEYAESSLMLATALNPYIGYEKAGKVVKEAAASNKTIREVVLEQKLIEAEELDRILDPKRMTISESKESE